MLVNGRIKPVSLRHSSFPAGATKGGPNVPSVAGPSGRGPLSRVPRDNRHTRWGPFGPHVVGHTTWSSLHLPHIVVRIGNAACTAALVKEADMLTRRDFLKTGAVAGGSFFVLGGRVLPHALAQLPGGTLDPTTIPKYVNRLVIPPVMPPLTAVQSSDIDRYAIAVRQFPQQILPAGMPATTVWGYGSGPHRGTFNYPSFTVEARADRPVRVAWINGLVDRNGRYLPHLLPVDPTLHWANPPGGIAGRDSRPTFTSTPGPYRGPVPFVTHLHGAHTFEESDGYPEAWYLPAATNIPAGYANV